ncbi:hypothetical protein M758_7G166200, partial [Ceratodon purpureus]
LRDIFCCTPVHVFIALSVFSHPSMQTETLVKLVSPGFAESGLYSVGIRLLGVWLLKQKKENADQECCNSVLRYGFCLAQFESRF